MRGRLERAERRAYLYEDEARGHLKARDARMAVNVVVAHLQSALSKEMRHGSERGLRVSALVAGIIEHLARAVPGADAGGTGRPALAELMDLFDKGLADGGA
jgi:20S proteasome alpha/beta subunit